MTTKKTKKTITKSVKPIHINGALCNHVSSRHSVGYTWHHYSSADGTHWEYCVETGEVKELKS